MHMNPLNLFGTRKRAILHHFSNETTIIEKVTPSVIKNLEKRYKEHGQAHYNSYDDFYIKPSNLLLFGKIDLNDSKDIRIINKSENKIWDALSGCHFVYSDLDYNTGIVPFDYDRHSYIGYSTLNLINWLKYNLLLLGFPENVVIYKIDKDFVRKSCPEFLTEGFVRKSCSESLTK